MRVLITGHKGFIGTVMVPVLQAEGHSILGIDSDLYRNSTYGPAPEAVDEICKDVRDIEPSDLEGVDAVVSLAALSNDLLGDLDPKMTFEINYLAAVRLAEMARELGISRYVFASSCSMYGASDGTALDESATFNPVTAYAESKVRAERDIAQLAREDFSPTFMRNATAYGMSPRIRFDVVLNNLSAWAFTTGRVQMKSDGSPWRPLVHIEDISRAVAAVLAAPRERVHNQAFNIGRNVENYQIRTIAEMVQACIPDCELSFADGATEDIRNYRVSFDKYEQTFPDYPLRWTAIDGIRQVYRAYREIGLGRNDYEGVKFKRIGQLRHLLSTGQVDSTLRWAQLSHAI